MRIPALKLPKLPDPSSLGTKVPKEELIDLFAEAEEGSIQMIYGRIRQGKSTEAVRRMLDDLERGCVVYSNLRLDLSFEELDERLIFSAAAVSLLRPGKKGKRFYRFYKENFHWFDPVSGLCDDKRVFDPSKKGSEVEWLNTITDAKIYYDEGQWLLDSYESTFASVAKRKLITESGHVGRTIVIIAQRTQSVHVNARGNVNQFFRCRKERKWLFFRTLVVEEFQDMKGNDVDEDADPVSVVRHYSSARAWNAFNTHYLRAGRPKIHDVHFDAYDLSYGERIIATIEALPLFPLLDSLFVRLQPDKKRIFGAQVPGTLTRQGSPDLFHKEQATLGVKSVEASLKNGGSKPSGFVAEVLAHKRALRAGSIHSPVGEDTLGIPF